MLPNCINSIRLPTLRFSAQFDHLLGDLLGRADDDVAGIDEVFHFGRPSDGLRSAAALTWLVRPKRIVASVV